MNVPHPGTRTGWAPPSLGFCLIVLTYSLMLAFFVWGLTTPALDRVWELRHQLKTGALYALGSADRQLLQSAMTRYPALAEALLPGGQIGIISAQRDGWVDTPEVSIIRTPRARNTQRIVLEVQTPAQHLPYHVTLTGEGWRREAGVQARGSLALEVPPAPATPELLSLKLQGGTGLRADPSSIAIRVTFDPPGDGASGGSDEDEDEREGEVPPSEPPTPGAGANGPEVTGNTATGTAPASSLSPQAGGLSPPARQPQ